MNTVTFIVGGEEYKLRLTTAAIIKLEEKLGYNPLHIFGDGTTTPKVTDLVNFLWAALLPKHNLKFDAVCNLFDAWLEENVPTDMLPVIIDVYKVSGLIKPKN